MTEGTLEYPLHDEPLAVLRRLRSDAPITKVTLWNGAQVWLITRHADARRALTDPQLSADATDPGFPSINPSQMVPNQRGGPARVDDGRHAVMRAVIARWFTARAVERWQPLSQQIVAEQLHVLLDGGPPADLVTRFALPVPLRLICAMLGVPPEDLAFVEQRGQLAVTRAYESARPAQSELRDFVGELIRRAEKEPGDDLISSVVAQRAVIDPDDLVDLLLIILVAGHTTTAGTISFGVHHLVQEPGALRALRDNPARVATTVEEFLRLQTIVSDGAPRVAKQDVELGSTLIRAGEGVIVSLTSANHDEDAFAGPDRLDPHRPDARRHLAFGWGIHRCLGQHLARLELRNAFAGLAQAVPDLRLAVPAEQVQSALREKHQNTVYELPVAW